MIRFSVSILALASVLACSPQNAPETKPETDTASKNEVVEQSSEQKQYLNQPLITEIYTADPSAHVFNGKIYIYPSHDIDAGIPDDDLGSQYAMRDYRVLSMDSPMSEAVIGPVALDVDQVAWADKQMWAPDAAEKDGKYFLYFPAKDTEGVFRIGVAVSENPEGPFTPQPEPIKGSFSIDPAVFTDTDGSSYMYFGGIWGGQLQHWASGSHDPSVGATDMGDDSAPALLPKIAKMSDDMLEFAEEPMDLQILDQDGNLILAGDHDKRFFEAAWVFKRDDTYYLLYSTGDTHYTVYATSNSPYGPFTYQDRVLEPVHGWTSHTSAVEFDGKWYLFYHDIQLSGTNSLRNVKMTELHFNEDGSIQTIDPFVGAN